MKNIIIIILLFITHSANGQNVKPSILDGPNDRHPVHVQLINRTGHKIDTLIIYKRLFLNLENKDSTDFFKTPHYEKSYLVRGSIQDIEIDNYMWSWNCKPEPIDDEGEDKTIIIEITLAESKILEKHYQLEMRIKEIVE